MWDVETGTDNVTFTLEGKDGEMGFPGNKKVSVTYSLSEDNALKLQYHVTSDADTIINMTNHTYFNLAGHKAGKIEDHLLRLNASCYTPTVPGSIPYRRDCAGSRHADGLHDSQTYRTGY